LNSSSAFSYSAKRSSSDNDENRNNKKRGAANPLSVAIIFCRIRRTRWRIIQLHHKPCWSSNDLYPLFCAALKKTPNPTNRNRLLS
jgi:hypothetical protein